MNKVTVILVVVGVILSILLSLVVYTVWKYIQTMNMKNGGSVKGKRKRASTDIDNFQVPMSYRTVKAQTPFISAYDCHGSRSEVTISPYTRNISSSNLSVNEKLLLQRKRSSLSAKELQLAESLPASYFKDVEPKTQFDINQKRISSGMIEQLAKQGRRTSAVDLRGASITEDMFIKSLTAGSTGGSISNLIESGGEETASVHSDYGGSTAGNEEVYGSTTVGQKRRLAQRRKCGSERYSLKRSYKKSGKIMFTTEHSESNNSLEVHVLRAFNLAPKRDVAEINPFVRLYLLPGKKQKQDTKFQKCTKEPFINQKLVFTDLYKDNFSKYRMKLKVYNYGMLKNDCLGEVDIALSSLDPTAKETYNIDLFLKRSESSIATVNVSLCHQATFKKLKVIVQEAKNLPKFGVVLPSPYATVSLFKENTIVRRETQTKRSTRDPVFNESVEFDVSTDSSKPLTTFSVAVTINSHNRMGKDEVIGHVMFCLSSPQKSAAEHWKAVQDAPHKHHTAWHSLMDPDELL